MYYMNAFQGEFLYYLNLNKPQDLQGAKQKVRNLGESWKASAKLDMLQQPRAVKVSAATRPILIEHGTLVI